MSLLAPLFLLGLLAALIPWWLHRLSASNPPQHDFGSTRFLDPTQNPSSKKRQTRYWPLLALRFLFLALLCLLFAEPVIEKLSTTSNGNSRHILVIDTSLSQNLEGRWAATLDAANKILDNASDSDEAIIITAANRFVQSSQQSNSVDSARDQLATLAAGNTRLEYGLIASAVSAAAAESDLNNHLHIITDIQASALPEKLTLLAVDKIQTIDIHSTASSADANTSVSGKLESASDNKANLLAIINNYGNANTYTLSAFSNGAALATAQVDVGENQSTVHRFSDIDITDAGTQIEIRVESNDSLTEDDSFLIPLPAKDKTEITLLTSDVQPSVADTYVKAALESNPRFVAKLTDITRFSEADAGSLIIVPNASVLSSSISKRLRDFVSSGGNALIAIGDRPHSGDTSALLGITSTAQTVADAQIVGAIDQSHQVTSGLSDNWRAVSVLQHYALKTNITDRNIIETTDGLPLLVEKRLGAGRIILLATALNPAWTDLPTESVFVAFIMQSIEFLGGNTTTALYKSTGETISVAAGTQLISPTGEPLRELSDISTRASMVVDEPGIYQLRNSAGTQSVAVNFDSRESDITPMDNDMLEKWRQVATNAPIDNITASSAGTRKQGFWKWLLPLLLILLMFESLYSHRHLWIRREAT